MANKNPSARAGHGIPDTDGAIVAAGNQSAPSGSESTNSVIMAF